MLRPCGVLHRAQRVACRLAGRACRDVRTPQAAISSVGINSVDSHADAVADGIRARAEDSGDDAAVDDDAPEVKRPPEWTKLLAITLTAGLVGIVELFVCKRVPRVWAPAFFLVSFILWRLSLRDVNNSNVPARSPDRLFVLGVIGLVFLWEHTARGMIVYAPWFALGTAVLLAPSQREMRAREEYLAEEVLARSEREYLNRLPVTPKESAAWVGRLLSCFWTPFMEPMLLKTAIVPLQEQVEAIAPQGWTLSLDGFSLGNVAPTISGWQVYNDTVTGEVESLTADLVLESTSLSVSLTGSGPLVGKFVVLLKGLTTRGTVRFVPFSQERLMLFSFVDKPDLDVKLNVRGRFIGSQSIPQFAFLRSAIIAAVQRDFVDPNYGVVPLEYAPVVGEAVSSRLHIRVLRISGLTSSDKAVPTSLMQDDTTQEADESGGVAIEINSPEETEDEDGAPKQMGKKMFERVLEQLPASSAGKVRISAAIEELNLERQLPLHDVDARGNVHVNQSVDLQLSAIQAALDIKVTNENGFRIGIARARAEHLPDGATAFWGTSRGAKPIAKRWFPGSAPWKATLDLDGTERATIEVELRMDPWEYSLDTSTPRQFRKGLRSVVAVQVLEARGLVSKDYNGFSDPYVLVNYNKRAASTRTVHRTLNPIFGDVLLFQENRSMLARRLRLDVYDRDRNKADGDTLGFAYVNLDLIAEGQVTEQWVQMRGSFTGELRIRMLVLSGTDDSVEVREEATRALETSQVVYTTDAVKCTVVRAEGLPPNCRGKQMLVEVTYNNVMQATAKRVAGKERSIEWSEDLRYRMAGDDVSAQMNISVRISSGGGLGLGGREVGFARVDTQAIGKELAKLRQRQRDGKDASKVAQPPQKRRLSPSRLLAGDLGHTSPPKRSKNAERMKVASAGDGVAVTRTNIAEVWLPLNNAGSDARILIELQGALGDKEQVQLNALQQTANLTSSIVDVEEAKTGVELVVQKMRQLGRGIASALFD